MEKPAQGGPIYKAENKEIESNELEVKQITNTRSHLAPGPRAPKDGNSSCADNQYSLKDCRKQMAIVFLRPEVTLLCSGQWSAGANRV